MSPSVCRARAELPSSGQLDAVHGRDGQVDGRETGRGARRFPAVPQLDAGQDVSGVSSAEQRQGHQRAAEGTAV